MQISYGDYLKSFYPEQEENVFTYNNWTLSDEFVQIIQSNFFYKDRVRWNIRRFRPSDADGLYVEDEVSTPSTRQSQSKDPEKRVFNNDQQGISQQSLFVNGPVEIEKITTSIRSTSECVKRKNESSNDVYEHQTRSQTRRMKRN